MQAVPLGFFLFLAELGLGGLLVTVLLDWDGEVSQGFLFLNGAFLVVFTALGLWLRATLPAERLVPYAAGRSAIAVEPWLWGLFVVAGVGYLALVRRDERRPARLAGTLASLVGLAAVVTSAAAYAPPAGGFPLTLLTLAGGAAALGTAWGGMMLGHWYLVTPLLAPRPLLRLNAALAVSLVAQAVFAGTAAAVAGGAQGGASWLFWLRLAAGIALPLLVALPIWRTARVRSMMSATGLLYVALGAVLAGEIIAKAFLFVGGVPV